ncbi:5'/3'-nucleotidase SurE [Cryptococcus depauperatus CBS 7841]|uniref:5'/3'-nucleotidase SurE n=1 Tax=Cryptococcus depauperatus CBS 7841 TaxID=1295531 RepID=A0AAJ8M1M1_9TREE
MPALKTYKERPVVLLTNDDGPPCASSPNIFSFCKLLQSKLGWDVRVVIPDCQKSWVGKAYAISDIITTSYFYPLEPDGLKGDISVSPRPLKEGETMEWILLSGTPASCANIALHNLYPGEIDLVVSGPNHGRNSSTAFALSSGTLGAALAASLSTPIPASSSGPSLHDDHIPCIAVSYGVVTRPVTPRTLELATNTAVDVCQRLFNDWGLDTSPGGKGLVQIYSINIPLVEAMLEEDKKKVVLTNMWRNAYGGLFKTTKLSKATYDSGNDPTQTSQNPAWIATQSSKEVLNKPPRNLVPLVSRTSTAGPAALPTPDPASPVSPTTPGEKEEGKQLKFHFAPNIQPLLCPAEELVPEGTDAWAFAKGWVSVTPMRAEYSCVDGERGLGADLM